MNKALFLKDGIFTKELRRRLKAKRIELGLTYFRLGNFLNTNWSTIRKWEKGLSASCRCSQRIKFWDFINGEYDQALKLSSTSSDYSFSTGLPPNIQVCMEKLTNTYMICKDLNDLQQDLVSNIDKVTSEILMEIACDDEPENTRTEQNQDLDDLLDETSQLDNFIDGHF